MKKYIFISLILLTSLACSVSTAKQTGANVSKQQTAKNTAQPTEQTPRRAVVVDSYGLNVRVCASTSCGLADPIPLVDGTNVVLTGDIDTNNGVWVKISYPVSGWVNKRYISEEK